MEDIGNDCHDVLAEAFLASPKPEIGNLLAILNRGFDMHRRSSDFLTDFGHMGIRLNYWMASYLDVLSSSSKRPLLGRYSALDPDTIHLRLGEQGQIYPEGQALTQQRMSSVFLVSMAHQ